MSLNLNCIMQLKQFYNTATKVSSRRKCYYFWWSTWLLMCHCLLMWRPTNNWCITYECDIISLFLILRWATLLHHLIMPVWYQCDTNQDLCTRLEICRVLLRLDTSRILPIFFRLKDCPSDSEAIPGNMVNLSQASPDANDKTTTVRITIVCIFMGLY